MDGYKWEKIVCMYMLLKIIILSGIDFVKTNG